MKVLSGNQCPRQCVGLTQAEILRMAKVVRTIALFALACVGAALVLSVVSFLGGDQKTLTKQKVDDIARPDIPDAKFQGAAYDTNHGGVDDEWLFKQTVRYQGKNTPRLVKTVFDNRKLGHLHPWGHEVLYEYYRQDGTLDYSEMIFPEASLGGGVYTKTMVINFDATGTKELKHQYFREDKTLGVVSDNNTFQQYRRDGKTLRFVQETVGKDLQQTYFRPDGKTPWWVASFAKDATTKVFFDLNGKPYNKEFRRISLAKSFSMSPGDQPVPYHQDDFLRDDGTVEYRQTWWTVWGEKEENSRNALRFIELMSADGKTVAKQYVIDISTMDSRFITQVHIYNPDGTVLIRKYRSPDCRQSETVVKGSKVLSETKFGTDDRFSENLDERLFHGFNVGFTGRYDDDSIDK